MSLVSERSRAPSTSRVQRTYEGRRAALWSDLHTRFVRAAGEDNRLKRIGREFLHNVGRRVASASVNDGPPSVCDVGCGNAHLIADLMRHAGRGYFLGVDRSFAMLTEADAVLRGVVAALPKVVYDLVGADASSLPVPDEVFDLVTAKLVLHHLADPLLFLQEAARIVRRRGRVLVLVPGPRYQDRIRLGRGQWLSTGFPPKRGPGHRDPLGRFCVRELQELAKRAGLLPSVVYVDSWVYRYRGLGGYLGFMGQTGADAKLREYRAEASDWSAPYSGILSSLAKITGPLYLSGEFLTLEAIKE